MKNKFFLVGSLILLTIFNSCSKDEPKPELKADFTITYISEFQNTIYPSMIFGVAELEKQKNEPMDWFTVTIKPNMETDIKIVIQESKINFETVITEYNVAGEKVIIPSVKWKYDELKKLTQQGIVDLTFICYGDENKEIGRRDIKLSYRSINECVYAAIVDNDLLDLSFMIAAYINEDSPIIDQFLQEVLQKTDLGSFVGYQANEDMVDLQVEAIFYTLRAKGIKYSSITNTSNTNTKIGSQYIRFVSEVLSNTQANCADGTAFFCSVLKKIDIHTAMVFIPGHVYLAYYLDEAKTKLRLLETTSVGNAQFDFIDALNYQVDAFNLKSSLIYNSDSSDGYIFIDVDEAREIIKPIGLK